MARELISGDYPNAIGNRRIAVIDHPGPASYTQVSVATPPTGGDSVQAVEFGLKSLDAVLVMGSDNGQYDGTAFPVSGQLQPSTSVILEWVVAHTGAEVSAATNLSARTMRLVGIGL